jgi:signal transduction histidine kinase
VSAALRPVTEAPIEGPDRAARPRVNLANRLQRVRIVPALRGAAGMLVRPVGVLSLLLVLATGIITGANVLNRQAHIEAAESATRELESVSLILADRLDRSLEAVELVLNAMVDQLMRNSFVTPEGFAATAISNAVHGELRRQAQGLPQIEALELFDARGELLNSSRLWPAPEISHADRDHYFTLRSIPGRRSHLGEPNTDPITGLRTIPMGQRVNNLDGVFAGFVVASLHAAFFEALHEAANTHLGQVQVFRIDPGHRIDGMQLLGGDLHGSSFELGRAIARASSRRPSTGLMEFRVQPPDGSGERLAVARWATRSSTVIVVSLDMRRVHAAADRFTRLLNGAAATLLLLIGLLGLVVLAALRAQRRLTEARLRGAAEIGALVGVMPVMLMHLKPLPGGWEPSLVTGAVGSVTGLDAADITAAWVEAALFADGSDDMQAALGRALTQGDAVIERRLQHADGGIRLTELRLRAVDEGETGPEVIAVVSDVTRERRVAAQLAHASKLATLGEVATGMAHELNQPLAGISMAAENAMRSLARMPDAPPRALEKLELIVSLTQRASEAIDHMRVFGRMGSSPSGPVAMSDVLAGADNLVQAKLRLGGVRLIGKLPADLPAVLGKRIPLEQVMINLISNACDAYAGMEEPPPAERRCIAICGRAEGGRVIVQVQDYAGGIPADILPRIFEPFFTTKDVGQGSGLGLSISYGIITEMGGSIMAEAADGGTRFTVELPAALPGRGEIENGSGVPDGC